MKVNVESMFPAARASLWKTFEQHFAPGTDISTIHPNIRSQNVVEGHGELPGFLMKEEMTIDRVLKVGRKTWQTRWKVDFSPPNKLRWEIVSGHGPVDAGTWIENSYAEVGGATRIASKGEIVLPGVPKFLAGLLVRRLMNQWDAQDLRTLQSLNL